jgi:hypothetical protein
VVIALALRSMFAQMGLCLKLTSQLVGLGSQGFESLPRRQFYKHYLIAYDNGASYIVVFDDDGNGGAILGGDQLNAMQQFWQYAKTHSPPTSQSSDRIAYVLPDAYGYGFRGLNDSIWGYWQADNFADQQYSNVNNELQQYGNKLDVIYDDLSFPNYASMYSKLIFWNGTIAQ